jgi:septum formation protein
MAVPLKYPLVLASASPRRAALLREWGYDFEVVPAFFDEPSRSADLRLSPALWAEALAYYKAMAVAPHRRDAIIVGADTIVEYSGQVVGKPRDEADARRILTTQFGGRNDVITGLAVLLPLRQRRIITHEVTTLDMRPMTPDELDDWLASGAWQGKAGAYALQEGGDRFVKSMVGSESNVVGLPLEKLAQALEQIQRDHE